MNMFNMPDFTCWAQNVLLKTQQKNVEELERALRECFNQGIALGRREGYDECSLKWWKEQDNQFASDEQDDWYNKQDSK